MMLFCSCDQRVYLWVWAVSMHLLLLMDKRSQKLEKCVVLQVFLRMVYTPFC